MENISNIKKIIKEAKDDPLLQSKLNIDEIIKAVNNVDMDYLGDRTLKEIAEEIYNSLLCIGLSNDIISTYCNKLIEYRLVEEIYQLHKGKHIRWVRISNGEPTLTNGGIVVDIKFLDNGTHIICKNKNRFIQYKFDDCITFQKLSQEEQLLLSCYNIVNVQDNIHSKL